jgi:hypothetical protein
LRISFQFVLLVLLEKARKHVGRRFGGEMGELVPTSVAKKL